MAVRVLLAPREGCSLEVGRGEGGGGGGEARAILVQVHALLPTLATPIASHTIITI